MTAGPGFSIWRSLISPPLSLPLTPFFNLSLSLSPAFHLYPTSPTLFLAECVVGSETVCCQLFREPALTKLKPISMDRSIKYLNHQSPQVPICYTTPTMKCPGCGRKTPQQQIKGQGESITPYGGHSNILQLEVNTQFSTTFTFGLNIY